MRKVFRIFGVIALAAAIIFSMAACNTDGDNDGEPQKGITINGIGIPGNVTVLVGPPGTFNFVAWGELSGVSTGSNVTISLKQTDANATPIENVFTNIDWNGSGTYTIVVFDQPLAIVMQGVSSIREFNSVSFSNGTATVSWTN